MAMRKIYTTLIIALAAYFSFACCAITEYPEEGGVDPTIVDVTLDISAVTQMLHYDTEEAVDADFDGSETMRYIIEIYDSADMGKALIREEETAEISALEGHLSKTYRLHARRYTVAVWCDFGTDIYNGSDLSTIVHAGEYLGYDVRKDCYADLVEADLTIYDGDWNVDVTVPVRLERPIGRFQIIADDVAEYLSKVESQADGAGKVDLSKYTVKCTYAGFVPVGYNVLTDKPNQADQGVGFASRVEQISDDEARISFDHVFANPADTRVTLNLEVYDGDGKKVNTVTGIEIPLKRNRLTTVKGGYLTKTTSPGIGIDPGFDGDINVPIPD